MDLAPLSRDSADCSGFATLDIETSPNGDVLDIGLYYPTTSGPCYRVFDGWRAALDFIFVTEDASNGLRTIWAHNGGGFDYLSLIEFIRQHKIPASICAKAGKIITMSLNRDNKTITFNDSLRILPMGLHRLSTAFFPDNESSQKIKLDILPHKLKRIDKIKYYDYLMRDCMTLHKCLSHFLQTLRQTFGNSISLRSTIGSMAMNIFRQYFLLDVMEIPTDKDFMAASRAAYSGGRVEVLQYGPHENITVYDVNSMYPYVMATKKYPFGPMIITNQITTVGIFHARWQQTLPGINLLSSRAGQGWVCGPELMLWRELSAGPLQIDGGYAWPQPADLFSEYSTRCFNLRSENAVLNIAGKLLGNNLYGKFGQRSENEKILFVDNLAELPDDCIPIDAERGIFAVEESRQCVHEFPALAALVTSYARVELMRYLIAAGSAAVYCDTDSVHCIGNPLDNMVSAGLGALKIEFNGKGIYLGRKLYALKNAHEKIRAKGVRVGGDLGANLTYSHFMDIYKSNGNKNCVYFSFPTFLEVLKGTKSCRKIKRQRRIRQT